MTDSGKITPYRLSEYAFKAELIMFFLSVECLRGDINNLVYADILGVPTIGIGYTVVTKDFNTNTGG